jgi:FkbM family methyltransferase
MAERPQSWRVPLSRLAATARHGLGVDRLSARLDAIEAALTGLSNQRYPHGPVYLGDHTAVLVARWGAKIMVDTNDTVLTPWLLLDGLWEANVTAWMQGILKPGQVFVDVGANIGYFTLLAAQCVGPKGRVVAVEAHPRLAGLLRRNVVMNNMHPYVTTWHRAAWSEATTLKFHLRAHYTGNSSAGSLGPVGLAYFDDQEEIVEVEAVSLDELLADCPHVDVMKVDVEGSEVHAFTGLARTLAANPGITIIFEWSPSQLAAVGDTAGALIDLLEGHGFRFRLIEDDLATIDRRRLLDLHYGNVVATR